MSIETPPPPQPAEEAAARWSALTRVAFRFVFCLLGLFYFPFPLSLVPPIGMAWGGLVDAVAGAVGPALFGVTVDTTPTGSGDRTVDWVVLFVIATLAVVITLIWSVVDRKAVAYPRLHAWFRVYLRFALAVSMIGYGAFKIIPSQFVAASLDRLIQPIGDASPMGLLWTFMGASAAYTIFTGAGELLGGLLLTSRRTVLLGALICAAVMTHVVMLNFSYDVPVKMYSSILLLTALVLAAPDTKRLFDFFLYSSDRPLLTRRSLRIAATVATVLFVAFNLYMSLQQSWQQRQRFLAARLSPSPFYGVWNVDELTVDGVAHPPLTTDSTRWRRLIVSGNEWGAIQNMDDSRTRFMLSFDEKQQALTLKKRTDPKFAASFIYRRPAANMLTLDGTFEGKKIAAVLRKSGQERTFLLNSRGFHWINEVPFNR